MSSLAEFTDSNFKQEVLASSEPVLVDFWAPWCPPCRALTPVIEQLAAENPGIKIGKLNTDDSPNSAIEYGISGIPALLFFKGGEVVERLEGLQSKSRLQQAINDVKG